MRKSCSSRMVIALSLMFASYWSTTLGELVGVTQDKLTYCAVELAAEVDRTYASIGPGSNSTVREALFVGAVTNFTTTCLGLAVKPGRALRIMVPKAPVFGVLQRRAAEFEKLKGVRVVLNPVEFYQVGDEIKQELVEGLNGFSDGWVLDPSTTGEVSSLGGFKSLDEYIPEDPSIEWSDMSRFFRVASAIYDSKVIGIPMDGDLMLMYYRRDLFTRYQLSVPRTWQEFVDLAVRMNGTDTDGDKVPDLHGVCFDTAPPVCKGNFILTAIAASYIQYQGTQQGVFFDPETMQPLTDNAAMARALQHYVDLFPLQPRMPSCGASNAAFRGGQCLMTVNWGDEFKANALLTANDSLGPAMSVAPLPGATEVLDRTTGRLVRCTGTDVCPYAKLAQLANGTKAYVNFAPYSAFGGWAGAISSLADPEYQLLAYQFFAYVVRPDNGWNDVLDPKTGIDPYRRSHLTSPDRWVAAGYEPNATLAYLAAVNEALESENMVLDSRLEFVGLPTRLIYEACLHNLTWYREGNPGATIEGTLKEVDRRIKAGLRATGTVPELRRQYCKLIGCTVATDAESGQGHDRTAVVALSVSIPLAATVLLLALLALVMWRRRNSRRNLLTGGVRAPAAGPATTLLITDIESSTALWECLPEDVMGKAVEVHHSVIRRALAKFSGYESATEGDSFVAAFHTATEAVQCALYIQQELLTAPWPPALLACSECPAVAEVSIAPGPTHAEAMAILAPRAARAGAYGGGPNDSASGNVLAGNGGAQAPAKAALTAPTAAARQSVGQRVTGGSGYANGDESGRWLDRLWPVRRRLAAYQAPALPALESILAASVASIDTVGASFHAAGLDRAETSYTSNPTSVAVVGVGLVDGPSGAAPEAANAEGAAVATATAAAGMGGGTVHTMNLAVPVSTCSANEDAASASGDIMSYGDGYGSSSGIAAIAHAALRAPQVGNAPTSCTSGGTTDGAVPPRALLNVLGSSSVKAFVAPAFLGGSSFRRGSSCTVTAAAPPTTETPCGLPSIGSVGSRASYRPMARHESITWPAPPGQGVPPQSCPSFDTVGPDTSLASSVRQHPAKLADFIATAWSVVPDPQSAPEANSPFACLSDAGIAPHSPNGAATQQALSAMMAVGGGNPGVSAGPGCARPSLFSGILRKQGSSRCRPRTPSARPVTVVRVYRGLRVRIGMASGVSEASDVTYNAAEARYHYSGAGMRLARAVQGAAAGGMVLLSDKTFAQQRQENGGANLTLHADAAGGTTTGSGGGAVGGSVVLWLHMGQHDLHRDLPPQQVYQAISQQLAGRLALFPPLVVKRCLATGVPGAPVKRAAVAFVHAVGAANLLAWDVVVARESLALLEETFARELSGGGRPEDWVGGGGGGQGYLVEATGGLLLAAFSNPAQAVACCLATVSNLLSVPWPDALLENALCEELAVPRVDATGQVTYEVLFRGLRIKAGLDYGPVHAAINRATGRVMYWGRVMNRAARISNHAATGQVLCSRDLLEAATRTAVSSTGAHTSAYPPGLRPALPFTTISMGPATLKGLPEPVVLLLCRPVDRASASRRTSAGVRTQRQLTAPAALDADGGTNAIAAAAALTASSTTVSNTTAADGAPTPCVETPRTSQSRADPAMPTSAGQAATVPLSLLSQAEALLGPLIPLHTPPAQPAQLPSQARRLLPLLAQSGARPLSASQWRTDQLPSLRTMAVVAAARASSSMQLPQGWHPSIHPGSPPTTHSGNPSLGGTPPPLQPPAEGLVGVHSAWPSTLTQAAAAAAAAAAAPAGSPDSSSAQPSWWKRSRSHL